jgi:hypothetical protein
MLGKLKALAGNAMVQNVIDKVTPIMQEQLEKIKSLSPDKMNDNDFFDSTISKPAWLAISASLGGLTNFYPALETKFPQLMRHLRDELVVVNDNTIALVDDFKAKLPQAVMNGLQL